MLSPKNYFPPKKNRNIAIYAFPRLLIRIYPPNEVIYPSIPQTHTISPLKSCISPCMEYWLPHMYVYTCVRMYMYTYKNMYQVAT